MKRGTSAEAPRPEQDALELRVVLASQDDAVDLDLVETHGARRLETREHAPEIAATRDARESRLVE